MNKVKSAKSKSSTVRDIIFSPDMKISTLIDQWKTVGGFQASHMNEAYRIISSAKKSSSCYKFLSFPSCIISTGTRGAIIQLVKSKYVDCIITTAGMIDHDVSRAFGNYFSGSFEDDDHMLQMKEIHRIGNVEVKMDDYGPLMSKKLMPFLIDMFTNGYSAEVLPSGQKRFSTKGICHEIGRFLCENNKKDTLLATCYSENIPIIIPGITDGAIGAIIWDSYNEIAMDDDPPILDLFLDETFLADKTLEAKKTSAIVIGGGISKHHTIWWNQFRGGLDYAVYLTSASEWDGSLSGARASEAICWNKIAPNAKYTTVYGDCTINLPLLVAALI